MSLYSLQTLLLMDVDVTKLRCIYWSTVKNIVEAEAYGIKCNLDKLKQDALYIRNLLSVLSISCDIPYSVKCSATKVIKDKGNTCYLSLDTCTTRYISDYEVIGIVG